MAVSVYDERNPSFVLDGEVDEQFDAVQAALQGPATLKRITRQTIAAAMAKRGGYADLLVWLEEKYGIMPWGWPTSRLAVGRAEEVSCRPVRDGVS